MKNHQYTNKLNRERIQSRVMQNNFCNKENLASGHLLEIGFAAWPPFPQESLQLKESH
jgi:hypothetical protein